MFTLSTKPSQADENNKKRPPMSKNPLMIMFNFIIQMSLSVFNGVYVHLFDYLLSSNTIASTCGVFGNISIGVTNFKS